MGQQAYNEGVTPENWPRIGKPHSAERYRCRNAWQQGYSQASGEGIDLIQPVQPMLNTPAKLVKLILELAPVSVRKLARAFSSRQHQQVLELLDNWAQAGNILISGTGKRASPKIIEKLVDVPQPKEG
jgi:hypothetical protein